MQQELDRLIDEEPDTAQEDRFDVFISGRSGNNAAKPASISNGIFYASRRRTTPTTPPN